MAQIDEYSVVRQSMPLMNPPIWPAGILYLILSAFVKWSILCILYPFYGSRIDTRITLFRLRSEFSSISRHSHEYIRIAWCVLDMENLTNSKCRLGVRIYRYIIIGEGCGSGRSSLRSINNIKCTLGYNVRQRFSMLAERWALSFV